MDYTHARAERFYSTIAPALAWAQMRHVCLVAVGIPLVVGLLVGVGGVFLAQLAGEQMAAVVMTLVVQLYPVSVGACAVVALCDDPLVELQESTPVGFRTVQLMRLAAVLAGGIVGACILFAPLHIAGVFPNDAGALSLLNPAGGAVVVALAAYAAASFTGSARTATMAVIAVLLFLTLFWDLQIPDPVAQRQMPLIVACAAAAIAWLASGRPGALLGKARCAR